MRRFFTLLIAASMVLGFSVSALAFGRFGPSDLMFTPTSGTLAPSVFGISGSCSSYDTVFVFDAGVAPNLEIGATIWIWDNWDDAALRLKYHLLSEKQDGVGLAVGLQDAGMDPLSPYVVLGKTLSPRLQGYLGLGGGQFDGLFFGLDLRLPSRQGADLILEYDSHDVNLAGRFGLGKGLRLDLGFMALEEVVVGVSYVNRF